MKQKNKKELNWKLTKIRKLQNDCSIIEFAIENDGSYDFDWVIVGIFFLPDSVFSKLPKQGFIQRKIFIVDETQGAK